MSVALKRPDAAGMSIPPPLLYAVPLIAGILIGKWFPLFSLPRTPLRIAGVILIAAGLLFGGWARILFLRHKTSIVPVRPVSAMIGEGPYRFSRHPIYIAFTVMYVGIALVCRAVWPFLFLPFVLLGIVRQARREEAYMERRFGAEYLSYKASVRRWL